MTKDDPFAKLRMILLIVVVGVLAHTLWSWVTPTSHYGILSFVNHGSPLGVAVTGLALAVIASCLGATLDRSCAASIGCLAVCMGLSYWVLGSGNFTHLLSTHVTPEARHHMFLAFVPESLFWGGLIYLGYLVPGLVRRVPGIANSRPASEKLPAPETEAPPKLNWINALIGLGLVCIIALIIMKFVIRSGPARLYPPIDRPVTTAPEFAQVIFGIYVAFYLAAWLVRHLFYVPTWLVLAGPIIAAIAMYVAASLTPISESMLAQSRQFVTPGVVSALILPVQVITVGSLGLLIGYWPVLKWEEAARSSEPAELAKS